MKSLLLPILVSSISFHGCVASLGEGEATYSSFSEATTNVPEGVDPTLEELESGRTPGFSISYGGQPCEVLTARGPFSYNFNSTSESDSALLYRATGIGCESECYSWGESIQANDPAHEWESQFLDGDIETCFVRRLDTWSF